MLIEDYEAKHWPINAPDPVEAIKGGTLCFLQIAGVGFVLLRLISYLQQLNEVFACIKDSYPQP